VPRVSVLEEKPRVFVRYEMVGGTEMARWEVERKADKYKTPVGSAEPSQMSNGQ
jgi:hypothetical protein